MKNRSRRPRTPRIKQAACTVSAAALMLGVSHAATVAMHFQCYYCGAPSYTGFVVTAPAFGVGPAGWQNLTAMQTGYGSGACASNTYTLSETISTNTATATNGLNNLPNGTLDITWSGATANYSDFGGYQDVNQTPIYNQDINNGNPVLFGGADQIYASFMRDGVNFGPGESGGNNNQPGYLIDITGLHSVFTNTPFVVELIASSDSMEVLTNAYVIDVTHSATNSVTYPNTAPVSNVGDTTWIRGHGGGLSTGSGAIALNADHLQIMSAHPAHGGSGASGYNNAGTISGFIITDKPVVSMSPNSVYGNSGDSVALSAYAIGVPPLSYQWRRNGQNIANATTTFYSIPNLNAATAGNYDLVVSNAYGVGTSAVAIVSADIMETKANDMVVDSNPANPEHDGLNIGATWLASSSDGIKTRTGVMQFVGTNNNSINVVGTTNLDSVTGSLMFWMRSAGTDPNSPGTYGAALLGQANTAFVGHGSLHDEFELIQQDSGSILFTTPGSSGASVQIDSGANVSDNNWHLVILTYDSSSSGGATLYIDGVLDTTNSNSSAWTPPAGYQLQAGFNSDGVLRSYTGLLDDIRVYNRELTATEVATIYANGSLIDTNALQMQLNFNTAPVEGLVLSWGISGAVLQSSLTANGTYTNVPSSSTPYYVVPKANQRYFRYLVPNSSPQAHVSNPYLM